MITSGSIGRVKLTLIGASVPQPLSLSSSARVARSHSVSPATMLALRRRRVGEVAS